MKIKLQRSPEPTPGGGEPQGGSEGGGIAKEVNAPEGAAAATPATPAPAAAEGSEVEKKEEKKEVNISAFHDPKKILAEAKDIGDIEDNVSIDDIEAGKVKGEEKKEKDGAKPPGIEKKDDEDDGPRFKIDDDESSDEGEKEIDEQPTWNLVSKNLDIGELKEDSFNAFQEKFAEVVEKKHKAGFEEGKKMALSEFPEDARKLFDFLSVEGNTVEAFMNPLKKLDGYLEMDSKSLVKEDYLLKGFSDEEADEFVENLEINDQIELRAKELKQIVRNARAQTEENLVLEARAKIKSKSEENERKRIAENDTFKENLGKANEFFGVPIGEREKSMLLKKYSDGVYKAMLDKDPNLEVKVALFLEFGEQLPSLMGNGKIQEGRMQILDKINNTKLPAGNQQSISSNEAKGFDAWEETLKKEREAVGG